MLIIDRIDTHDGLASSHFLACVDQTLDDLASDSEAEIALHARGDDACEGPLWRAGPFYGRDSDKLLLGSRVLFGFAAGCEAQRGENSGRSNSRFFQSGHVRGPKRSSKPKLIIGDDIVNQSLVTECELGRKASQHQIRHGCRTLLEIVEVPLEKARTPA
ncbi:hypothetical protein MSC49_32420 [Methylosinus sp. C49]|nr:hypothetical protein MSC49_32420 [Methylosinus sp. C49]